MADSLADLTLALRAFAAERDWEVYHSPKNLAMALTGEAGELAAEFQWLTEAESRDLAPAHLERVRQEAADVLLYLTRLADRLDFDLVEAARAKMVLNAARYPADKARGNARKYGEL
ncbi:nucleotide pyrophosphohydrolase [Mesoterricola sediminis]|uniref:Nucleotide pyrophosphohydrolase n=1 Tax=Mesoterricola sediminis TaxID=2927980 RepID=A0AA48KCU1_9BACT|nr:nucleotide pyrophosphohydrolase [Mesoterricola sediminis]BDU77466.1 nucleotide pyrophosphohydrolase [Mesoterricola sediminis]